MKYERYTPLTDEPFETRFIDNETKPKKILLQEIQDLKEELWNNNQHIHRLQYRTDAYCLSIHQCGCSVTQNKIELNYEKLMEVYDKAGAN